MALSPGFRLGPYEILDLLGAGGMGEVYRARDTRLGRVVAIKILTADATSPHALERFEREAKAIAALNHPGICAIYDVGTSPLPFLVMELLDGETLHKRLTRGPIDAAALIDSALALADALSAAHGKGILHRDLKPANIVLSARGPKILDFGLARATEPASLDHAATAYTTLPGAPPLTDTGTAVGTAAYMSPEQLRGEALDARSDLFSLGLVLYEMATGRRAFSGATSAVITAAILHEDPTAPRLLRPDLPSRLEKAILTLLEKDRDLRTQTASELRAELQRMRREPTPVAASQRAHAGAVGPGSEATAAHAETTAASRASVTAASLAGPAPASSSDAQIIAGVLHRHRGATVGALAIVLLVIGFAVYLATRSGATNIASGTPTRPSIANLAVEQLTTSGTAGYPAISPDGKYVAYVETGATGTSLRMRQVATGSNVEIVPAEPGVTLFAPAVTPDGTFVNYIKRLAPQRFELWQVPFLGGAPRQLLTRVETGVGFSPDGRQMAYVRNSAGGKTEVVVTAVDGSGEKVLATRQMPSRAFHTIPAAQGLGWFAPAWSPDGSTLALMGVRDNFASGQIVFIDTGTGKERTLDAASPLPGPNLAWLDEGTLILSFLERSSATMQLWLLAYPEGTFTRLTNDTNQYDGLSLTADRGQLVTARTESSMSIWTSDSAGTAWTQTGPPTPQKGPIGVDVAWLGDDLIFPSMASGTWALERWRPSTRTRETLAPAGGLPQVSRDGTIVFLNYDTVELWKMDQNGRNKVSLGRATSNTRITPDGQQVTFTAMVSGTPSLQIRSVDGTGETRTIPTGLLRPGATQVSPDGKWIAYPSFDNQKRPAMAVCDFPACASTRMFPIALGEWTADSRGLAYPDARGADIWLQPLDGGAARQLTHFPEDGQRIWCVAFSADGRLAVGRASTTNNIVLLRGLKQPAR